MNKDLIKGIIIGVILTMCSCFMMGDVEIKTDFIIDRKSNQESSETSL